MSWEMVNLIMKADLPRPQKLVMLGIANHAGADGGGSWASYDRYEYYTGYNRRQLMRIVQELEKNGYIKHCGFHSDHGTNIWTIIPNKIPMQLEFEEWRKLKRQEEAEKERVKLAAKAGGDILSQGDISSQGGVTFCESNSDILSPNPIQITFIREPSESLPKISQNGANGSVNGKILPADAGGVGLVTVEEDPWEDAFTDAPVQKDYLSEDKDHEYSRGDPDGDDDPRDAHRARTPLEMKITQLTKSKYLTDAQRAKLSTPVSQSYGNQLPQDYPSPEDEWRANPKLFAEYVELCAKLIANGSGRNPSRSALITTMRNYARNKSGWLFFKNFKEEASAPARQVKKQYYHNDATPSWRA